MKKLIPILIAVAILFATWWVASILLRPEDGGREVLPGPLAVFGELANLFAERHFLTHILQSLKRIFLGLLAATVPAFILGIWFGLSPRAMETAKPLFSFAKMLPPVALIPILIMWLGLGLRQQIALLFIGTFFHLTMMVATTVTDLPVTYRDAARTLGITPRQFITRVVVPYGLPEFINHIRIMVGVAWTYVIVVEMVAAQDGLGRVIIDSMRFFLTGQVLAGVFTIGVLGILIDLLLQLVSYLACPWKREKTAWG